MSKREFIENFEIGNTNIELKLRRLSHGIKPQLRNYFGRYGIDQDSGAFDDLTLPIGTIETIVFKNAVAEITVGTEKVRFRSANPVDDLPDIGMGDEEDEPDLYEEIMKRIVRHNPFLAKKAPFLLVFAQYLDDEELAQEVDPTSQDGEEKEAASSTVQRIAGS